MPWYVIYTNAKAEKKVAEQLASMGIEVYCPTITKIRQWSDRKKKVEVPLFSSYVFVNIEEDTRALVFSAKGVVRYLYWLGKPAVVKPKEIQEIKDWMDIESVGHQFEITREGDIVEIKRGHFKGHTGTVQQITKNYIRLVIQSIGFSIVIKILSTNDSAGKPEATK